MSYDSTPNSGQRKPRGSGGMMILIIIAIGAFLLLRNGAPDDRRPQSETSTEEVYDSSKDNSDYSSTPGLGGGGDFESRPMPSGDQQSQSSDWGFEEVETKSTIANKKVDLKNPGSKTTNGDWSIEEVDSQSGSNPKSENHFQISSPGNKSDTLPAVNSGGDWSIEDAGEVKPKKKTVSGDWSIEDGQD